MVLEKLVAIIELKKKDESDDEAAETTPFLVKREVTLVRSRTVERGDLCRLPGLQSQSPPAARSGTKGYRQTPLLGRTHRRLLGAMGIVTPVKHRETGVERQPCALRLRCSPRREGLDLA